MTALEQTNNKYLEGHFLFFYREFWAPTLETLPNELKEPKLCSVKVLS